LVEGLKDRREMTFLEHVEELRTRLIRIFVAVGVVAAICFFFQVREMPFGVPFEGKCYFLYPSVYNNIASQIILKMENDLTPSYVRVMQATPEEVLVAELYVAIFLGVVFAMPVIVREIGAFVGPGLYPHEKKTIIKLLGPISGLFAAGSIFSYYIIVPFAFKFLYAYGAAIDVLTLLKIEDFIWYVIMFMAALGLSFQLPVIMWAITKADIVEPDYWKQNILYAIALIVVFGAIITPDGSGVTMWLVAAPMIALYLAGYYASKRGYKPEKGSEKG